MKTSKHVDQGVSAQLHDMLKPKAGLCYYYACLAATTLVESGQHDPAKTYYCEGWGVRSEDDLSGVVSHGWVEVATGQIVDVTGAALLYVPSTRLSMAQMQQQLPELSIHGHSEKARQRHQRALREAVSHVLGRSPDWDTVYFKAVPPPR